ncbi:MAG: hypothetical protein ACK5SA_14575 [Planctomycetota bacterium]
MRFFVRFQCGLVICWAAAMLLLADQASAQSDKYEEATKAYLEEQLEAGQNRLARIDREQKQRAADLSVLQAEIDRIGAESAGREQKFAESGVTSDAYSEVLVLLQTMRAQLKIDLAGLKAKQEFLRGLTPADAAKQAYQLVFLRRKREVALQIRELSLATLERTEQGQKRGIMSIDEVNQAKVDSANADLRVIELEGQLEQLQAELEDANQPALAEIQKTGLEIAEKEARLGQVEIQLKATAEVSPKVVETEIARRMLSNLDAERERLLDEISVNEIDKKWTLRTIEEVKEELLKRIE